MRVGLVLALVAGSLAAQESKGGSAARLEAALLRRPESTGLFERWCSLLAEGGGHSAMRARAAEFEHRDDPGAALVRARLLERLGDAAAEDAYVVATRLSSGPHAWMAVARLRDRRGDRDAVVQAWREAELRAESPEDRDRVAIGLCEALHRAGGREELARRLDQVLATHAADRHALAEWALRCEEFEESSRALAAWSSVLKLAEAAGDRVQCMEARLECADQHAAQGERAPALAFRRAALEQVDSADWRAARILESVEQSFRDEGDEKGWLDFLASWVEARPQDLAMRIQQARALRRSGRGGEALRVLRRAKEAAPAAPSIRREEVDALLAEGRIDAAIAALEELERLVPDDASLPCRRAQLWLRHAGDASRRVESAARACAALATLAARDRGDGVATFQAAEAALALAASASALGNVREALHAAACSHFEAALEQDPSRFSRFESYARFLFAAGRTADGWRVLQRMIEPPHDRFDALSSFAALAWQIGRHDAAIETWSRAADRVPDDVNLRRRLVRALMERERFGEARLATMAGLAAVEDEARLDALLRLRLEVEGGAGKLAEAWTAALEEMEPNFRHAWWTASLGEAVGALEEALAFCELALAQRPRSARVAFLRAQLFAAAGREEDALAECRALAQDDSAVVIRAIELALQIERQRGGLAEALVWSDRLLERAPSPDAYLLRAGLFESGGETAAALRCMRRAVRRFPLDTALRRMLAHRLMAAEAPAEAAEHLWVALQRAEDAPARGELLVELGDAARSAGNAVRWAPRVMTWARDRPTLREQLAGIDFLMRARLVSEAIRESRRADARWPGQADILRPLAQLEAVGGDLPAAIAVQERLLRHGGDPEDRRRLARWRMRTHDYQEALRLMEPLPPLGDGVEACITDVLSALAEGRSFDAFAASLRAHDRFPESGRLGVAAACFALSLGDEDEARRRLATVRAWPRVSRWTGSVGDASVELSGQATVGRVDPVSPVATVRPHPGIYATGTLQSPSHLVVGASGWITIDAGDGSVWPGWSGSGALPTWVQPGQGAHGTIGVWPRWSDVPGGSPAGRSGTIADPPVVWPSIEAVGSPSLRSSDWPLHGLSTPGVAPLPSLFEAQELQFVGGFIDAVRANLVEPEPREEPMLLCGSIPFSDRVAQATAIALSITHLDPVEDLDAWARALVSDGSRDTAERAAELLALWGMGRGEEARQVADQLRVGAPHDPTPALLRLLMAPAGLGPHGESVPEFLADLRWLLRHHVEAGAWFHTRLIQPAIDSTGQPDDRLLEAWIETCEDLGELWLVAGTLPLDPRFPAPVSAAGASGVWPGRFHIEDSQPSVFSWPIVEWSGEAVIYEPATLSGSLPAWTTPAVPTPAAPPAAPVTPAPAPSGPPSATTPAPSPSPVTPAPATTPSGSPAPASPSPGNTPAVNPSPATPATTSTPAVKPASGSPPPSASPSVTSAPGTQLPVATPVNPAPSTPAPVTIPPIQSLDTITIYDFHDSVDPFAGGVVLGSSGPPILCGVERDFSTALELLERRLLELTSDLDGLSEEDLVRALLLMAHHGAADSLPRARECLVELVRRRSSVPPIDVRFVEVYSGTTQPATLPAVAPGVALDRRLAAVLWRLGMRHQAAGQLDVLVQTLENQARFAPADETRALQAAGDFAAQLIFLAPGAGTPTPGGILPSLYHEH